MFSDHRNRPREWLGPKRTREFQSLAFSEEVVIREIARQNDKAGPEARFSRSRESRGSEMANG